MSPYFRVVVLLCFLLPGAVSHAQQEWLSSEVSNDIEVDYKMNCDSIVDDIRKDSRLRMPARAGKATVEQIYERETIKISEEKVNCKGIALLSNGRKRELRYGAYIDSLGDTILFYNVE